ncbi:hypothetical protein [Bradyrhizobium guangdongense]
MQAAECLGFEIDIFQVRGLQWGPIGAHKRLPECAGLLALAGLPLSFPAVADVYPVTGIWVTLDSNFPIGADEACFAVRLSGVEAVGRDSIAEMIIFNGDKRYDVKPSEQLISKLTSSQPTPEGYWITESLDVRRRLWFRPKITYLLTIVNPTTIEVSKNLHRTKFVKCGPRKLPI